MPQRRHEERDRADDPSVKTPPTTTDGTVPTSRATTPLSNAPSSFDAPMNTQLTDATRPRIASGERTRRIVARMTMLMPSVTPLMNRAASEITKLVDSPNTSMLTPKPATQMRNVRPACRLGGQRVATSMTRSAPSDGAVRSTPRPAAPTWRTSVAKTGRSAMAPPKKTAKRSSAIDPRSGGLFRT